jgi:hypothetical protein
MPEVSWAQMRDVAARMGHRDLRVYRMRNGLYRYECACGMRSKGLALEVEAVKLAVRHFELVVSGDWERPKFPGGPSHAEAVRRDLKGREKAARKAQERHRAAS